MAGAQREDGEMLFTLPDGIGAPKKAFPMSKSEARSTERAAARYVRGSCWRAGADLLVVVLRLVPRAYLPLVMDEGYVARAYRAPHSRTSS